MALIPKVEPKQEKKVVSARLDEEAHTMLQRYAAFLGGATHEYIIGESLKRLFRRDKEFNEWLEKNHAASTATLTHLNLQPNSQEHNKDSANGSMIQRVLNSKNFLAVLLALVTGTAAVLQDALADDSGHSAADLERVLPSIDRPSRPLDVRGTESFLSCDAVHHALHRLFILAVRAVHLYVAAKTSRKAAAVATLSGSGNSEQL